MKRFCACISRDEAIRLLWSRLELTDHVECLYQGSANNCWSVYLKSSESSAWTQVLARLVQLLITGIEITTQSFYCSLEHAVSCPRRGWTSFIQVSFCYGDPQGLLNSKVTWVIEPSCPVGHFFSCCCNGSFLSVPLASIARTFSFSFGMPFHFGLAKVLIPKISLFKISFPVQAVFQLCSVSGSIPSFSPYRKTAFGGSD